MRKQRKTEQLQIRVSPPQKRAIQKQAQIARMNMSDWVLAKLLPSAKFNYRDLLEQIAASEKPSFAFAELLELIGPMSADEFASVVAEAPVVELDPYWKNYLAATIEHAAAMKHARAPSWTRDVIPLAEPVFGSSLESLKLHLLVNSPPAFIARNIFVDSSVGDRV